MKTTSNVVPRTRIEVAIGISSDGADAARSTRSGGFLRSSRPSRSHGFTLVELMIVIIIIAVLAAVLVLLTRTIKSKAQEANSIAASRQIATILVSFSADNNGDIHFLRDGNDPLAAGAWVKKSFWGYLQPYIAPEVGTNNQKQLKSELVSRLESIFCSRELGTMQGTFLYGSKIYSDGAGKPLSVPFAFNTSVRKWNNYIKLATIDDPSQTMYFTYGFYAFNESDGKVAVPVPNTDPAGTSNIYWFANRATPAVFLDGHTEVLTAPIPDRRFK